MNMKWSHFVSDMHIYDLNVTGSLPWNMVQWAWYQTSYHVNFIDSIAILNSYRFILILSGYLQANAKEFSVISQVSESQSISFSSHFLLPIYGKGLWYKLLISFCRRRFFSCVIQDLVLSGSVSACDGRNKRGNRKLKLRYSKIILLSTVSSFPAVFLSESCICVTQKSISDGSWDKNSTNMNRELIAVFSNLLHDWDDGWTPSSVCAKGCFSIISRITFSLCLPSFKPNSLHDEELSLMFNSHENLLVEDFEKLRMEIREVTMAVTSPLCSSGSYFHRQNGLQSSTLSSLFLSSSGWWGHAM